MKSGRFAIVHNFHIQLLCYIKLTVIFAMRAINMKDTNQFLSAKGLNSIVNAV